MRILFLHNNFPAQFGGLARYLSGQGHEVRFGTRWEGTPPGWLHMVRFRPHREVGEQQHPYLRFLENAVLNGQALARVGWQMKEKGYSPDLVVAHSGWGPGLYVRDVWPDAKYLGYFEWYYRPDGADVGFLRDVTRDDGPRIRTRNAAILLDLAECHWGLVPTEYQASQFPALLRRKLTVQHDGVDTEHFAPQPGRRLKLPGLDLSHVDELVTYVARGMEPYRGFPQAMSAFAEVQKRRPRAHVVVVGQDRVAYGRALPDGDTWRKKMLRELELDRDRLHFTGLLPRDQYREVLLASSVHVYLTVPFVLSWSMNRGDERRLRRGRLGHRPGARGHSRRRERTTGGLLRHRRARRADLRRARPPGGGGRSPRRRPAHRGGALRRLAADPPSRPAARGGGERTDRRLRPPAPRSAWMVLPPSSLAQPTIAWWPECLDRQPTPPRDRDQPPECKGTSFRSSRFRVCRLSPTIGQEAGPFGSA